MIARSFSRSVSLLVAPLVLACVLECSGASATWREDPVSGEWFNTQNWIPATPPNQWADEATFGTSSITSISAGARVGAIVFTEGASGFTIAPEPGSWAAYGGAGIINNSGRLQKFEIAANSTVRGSIEFTNNASAGSGTEFRIRGGVAGFQRGGLVWFFISATAGAGSFIVEGGNVSDASGGQLEFHEFSSAGNGAFRTQGGAAVVANGATLTFHDSANAGNGVFTTTGGVAQQGRGGSVQFWGSANAANGTFINEPGIVGSLGSVLSFFANSGAGSARITNKRAPNTEQSAGQTQFASNSSAELSAIVNEGGPAGFGNSGYGRTSFRNSARAAQAQITNEAGAVAGHFGGYTFFGDTATASGATIVNHGSAVANARGGLVEFYGSVTPSSPSITNHGASVPEAGPGTARFSGASAGQAVIVNQPGTNGSAGGMTEFAAGSSSTTAGSATITNKAPAEPASGGVTVFRGGSAGGATITCEGSAVAGDAAVIFESSSTASASAIELGGATAAGGLGGRLRFDGSSTAGAATFHALSGAAHQAAGGRIIFTAQSQGGTARAILQRGASLDISSVTTSGVSIGRVEGDGDVYLGAKTLSVGAGNFGAEFGGTFLDGGLVNAAGGSLTKIGTGTLTLTGANQHTGATTMNAGVLRLIGSVIGPVVVNAGTFELAGGTAGAPGTAFTVAANGTLTGSGTIRGDLTNHGLVTTTGAATLFLTGHVTNNGVLRVKSGGTLDAGKAQSFTNNGTLDIMTGTAHLPPNFTNGPGGVVLDTSRVRVKEITRSGTQALVKIDSYSGHTYQLQRSTSLATAPFQNDATPQQGQTGTTLTFAVTAGGEHEFYRVVVD